MFGREFLEKCKGFDRFIFRALVLLTLFAFSIGPIVHTDLLSKVLSVVASLSLSTLAGCYLFSKRKYE